MSISNRDIYKNALAFIGQSIEGNCSDYEERAPYLIAAFCCIATDIDTKLRSADGILTRSPFNPVYMSLDTEFPFSDRLAGLAALYVGAMLVVEELPELSEALYDKYCVGIMPFEAILEHSSNGKIIISDISSGDNEHCAVCESITERYFFD